MKAGNQTVFSFFNKDFGNNMQLPLLTIIAPCLNEEEIIDSTGQTLDGVIVKLIKKKKISENSFVLFVDDGSTDRTWQLIEKLSKNYKVAGVKLKYNFGQQSALFAGIKKASKKADIIITIDADLQDDIKCIEKMVDAFDKGYEIVYGVRANRDSDSWFKRNSALFFYKIALVSGKNIIENHGDFRLISKKVAEKLLSSMKGKFIRGVIPNLGYKSTKVFYTRLERQQGSTKYSLAKMIMLAWQGLFPSRNNQPVKVVIEKEVGI